MQTNVGERIKRARERRKLTRPELADRLGMSRLRVWRVETGVTKIDADELPKWARALRVKVSELYTEAA